MKVTFHYNLRRLGRGPLSRSTPWAEFVQQSRDVFTVAARQFNASTSVSKRREWLSILRMKATSHDVDGVVYDRARSGPYRGELPDEVAVSVTG